MKKRYWILLIFAVLIVVFLICSTTGNRSLLKEIGKDLGLNLSTGTIIASEDTHGGFHGDGTSIVTIQFPDDALQADIEDTGNWLVFPPDTTIQTILYGHEVDGRRSGPYLTYANGMTLPEITNGYYWLKDRQSAPASDLLGRGSLNFTLSVYDADTHILYYCKMDT